MGAHSAVAPAESNADSLRDPIDSDVPHAFAEDLADLELLASVVVAEPLASVVVEGPAAVVAAVAEQPDAAAVVAG